MKEDDDYQDDQFCKILRETPLDIRIKVPLEMSLIAFLADNGFIENRMWTDSKEDSKLLRAICNWSKEQTEDILEIIKKWEKDGSPE